MIDSDGHVIETDDLWVRFAPASLRDRWPHFVDGSGTFMVDWDAAHKLQDHFVEELARRAGTAIDNALHHPDAEARKRHSASIRKAPGTRRRTRGLP